jgi:hypothetical protein
MFLVDDLSANEAIMLDINNTKHKKYSPLHAVVLKINFFAYFLL